MIHRPKKERGKVVLWKHFQLITNIINDIAYIYNMLVLRIGIKNN